MKERGSKKYKHCYLEIHIEREGGFETSVSKPSFLRQKSKKEEKRKMAEVRYQDRYAQVRQLNIHNRS
nr:hypothetical protein [Lachnospiraceae bacterium]